MNPTPAVHPEFQRLSGERDLLREELARLLAEHHILLSTTRPYLLALYQAKLGGAELRRLELQSEAAMLKRQAEMAQAALNRGERPNAAAIAAATENERAEWWKKIAAAADRLEKGRAAIDAGLLTPAEAHEIKAVYRRLVKQLHPDLHPNQDAAAAALWRRVQAAYDGRDLEELRALALMVRAPAAASEPGSLEALAREIEGIKSQIARKIAQLDALRQEPPFNVADNLDNEAWVEARLREIETEVRALETRRGELEVLLRTLLPRDENLVEFGSN